LQLPPSSPRYRFEYLTDGVADLAAAKAFTEVLLFLSGSEGECAVEIFELLPM
jgi:hypothetical protein